MDGRKNASLTPCGRKAMVRRVVELGQTPKAVNEEAVAVCPQRALVRSPASSSRKGVAALEDRSSQPHLPVSDPTKIIARSKEGFAAPLALGVAADRERDPRLESDRVSHPSCRLGLNRLRKASSQPSPFVATASATSTSSSISISKSSANWLHWSSHHRTPKQESSTATWVSAGVDRHRRRLSCCLQSRHEGREKGKRRRLPQSRRCLLCEPRREGRARHDRQWVVLPFRSLQCRACKQPASRHIFTDYTPKTNGKAERPSRPVLREWAYARAYNNSVRPFKSNSEMALSSRCIDAHGYRCKAAPVMNSASNRE